MSTSDSNSDDQSKSTTIPDIVLAPPTIDEPSLVPELESPPSAENPSMHLDGLFQDETLAPILAKFSIVEDFLKLLTKDYRFQDFMREMLLAVMKAVRAEAGSILEVDHENKVLFFRAAVGQKSDSVSSFTIPFGQGIAGYVAESRTPVIEDNLDDNLKHMRSIQDAVAFKSKNLAALPIVVRGRIYGVLELLNRLGEEKFTRNDLDLLNYICEMMAKAIEVRMMLAWTKKSNLAQKKDETGEAA